MAALKPSEKAKAAQGPNRSRDAEATKRNILEAALREFSQSGYDGARVDTIAAKTATSKRMIYYYFGSKSDLYLAVLKASYEGMRQLEAQLNIDDLPPILAMKKLVETTVDYQASHPDFIRIVMTENIHQGAHIRQLPELKALNSQIIMLLEELCQRGAREGVFRPDIDAVDLHMTISALSFFNVSNQHTFGYLFDRELDAPGRLAHRRDEIVETVLRYVRQS